VINCRPELCHN